jgi:hypothetical protein
MREGPSCGAIWHEQGDAKHVRLMEASRLQNHSTQWTRRLTSTMTCFRPHSSVASNGLVALGEGGLLSTTGSLQRSPR